MKEEISCGAIIIDNNKVALVEQQSGFIGFPKGHIENDETEVETAIREVKEETNLDVMINSNLRYTISYPIKDNTVNKIVVLFLAKLINNNKSIPQEEEIKNILFVDIDKVEDLLTFDDLKDVWKLALKDIDKL